MQVQVVWKLFLEIGSGRLETILVLKVLGGWKLFLDTGFGSLETILEKIGSGSLETIF